MEEILAGGLEDLIRTVKELSPVVWEATRRRVIAEAVMNILWSIGLAMLATLCFKAATRFWQGDTDDPNIFMSALFTFMGCLVFGIWAAMAFHYSVLALISPDYATLQKILETIK